MTAVNPANVPMFMPEAFPLISMSAMEHETSLTVEPARCTVAQSGMTKSAISGRTPLAMVWARVTGIVAADEDVPSAVT